jgi:hypothetical protein
MKAGAPKGNKNNERWNKEESQKFVNMVYDYVKKNKDCCSIEEACCELGEYEKVLNYIENKGLDIDFNPIRRSNALIKSRIIKQSLNNKYNATTAIFVLKNNHDMKDKQEVDQQVTVKDIPPLKWFKND